MADYLITGKKGNGKTIFAVGVIRDALMEGKRVATNLDIYLEPMFSPWSRKNLIRLPDVPSVDDFIALGYGSESVVEEDNGVIVLDEVSKIFNSRNWGDKERQPILDWLVHSRKYGWDVYMVAQGQEQIDKQLRSSLLEYWVVVKRTDKWPIPVVTSLTKAIIKGGIRLPKMHIVTIRHGFDQNALVVDRKWYRGAEIYPCYDTRQIFKDRDHPQADAIHSVLSPWHVSGRYQPRPRTFWSIIADWYNKVPAVKPQPLPIADPHPLVLLLRKLPEAERLKHWRRLNELGAFDPQTEHPAVLRHYQRHQAQVFDFSSEHSCTAHPKAA